MSLDNKQQPATTEQKRKKYGFATEWERIFFFFHFRLFALCVHCIHIYLFSVHCSAACASVYCTLLLSSLELFLHQWCCKHFSTMKATNETKTHHKKNREIIMKIYKKSIFIAVCTNDWGALWSFCLTRIWSIQLRQFNLEKIPSHHLDMHVRKLQTTNTIINRPHSKIGKSLDCKIEMDGKMKEHPWTTAKIVSNSSQSSSKKCWLKRLMKRWHITKWHTPA